MRYHLMHDIETLSSNRNAVILSVGAVMFSFDKGSRPDEKFYLRFAVNSQPHRDINADTVRWWFNQDPLVRAETFAGTMPLSDGLFKYATWINEYKPSTVWSNGADFDNVILQAAFDQAKIKCPWHYRASRCFRTLCGFAKERVEAPAANHNAVLDAQRQTDILKKLLDDLNLAI